jgi:hypothetical protein
MRLNVDGQPQPERVDPPLLKAIARAQCWFASDRWSRSRDAKNSPSATFTRIAKLACVSPVIAEAVVGGRAPAGVNLQMLMDSRLTLPLDWNDQHLLL